MGVFDQAERYAIKRIDPAGFLRWLLASLSADLVFRRWLETQLTPFPGEPDRRCDCVAELVSASGTGPAWACLVEPQGQPQADFVARVLQYLLMLHQELRADAAQRDRYLMVAGIVNVCDRRFGQHLDWRPPGVVGVGLTAGVWVRNVYEEPAGATLEAIASGRVAACVLPWVPLMEGGEEEAIAGRWKDVAGQEPDRQLRLVYGSLAIVFSEKRRRSAVWRTALEGWNVEESTIVQEWMKQGESRGESRGMRGMLLEVLRGRFGTLPPALVARIEAIGDASRLSRLGAMAAAAGVSLEQIEATAGQE